MEGSCQRSTDLDNGIGLPGFGESSASRRGTATRPKRSEKAGSAAGASVASGAAAEVEVDVSAASSRPEPGAVSRWSTREGSGAVLMRTSSTMLSTLRLSKVDC